MENSTPMKRFYSWKCHYHDEYCNEKTKDINTFWKPDERLQNLWDTLKPILEDLAILAEANNIPSSPCFDTSGSIPAICQGEFPQSIYEFEQLYLNPVWTVARRLEAKLVIPKTDYAGNGSECESSIDLPTVDTQAGTVTFQGKTYSNLSNDALLLFEKLIKAHPQPIIANQFDLRPDRIIDSLPRPLKSLIVSMRGKGTALAMPNKSLQ